MYSAVTAAVTRVVLLTSVGVCSSLALQQENVVQYFGPIDDCLSPNYFRVIISNIIEEGKVYLMKKFSQD